MRRARLIAVTLSLACESGPASTAGDALARDDGACTAVGGCGDAATVPDAGPDVPPPAASLEQPLTSAEFDALFPTLEGDTLVWVTGRPIPEEGVPARATDAVDCLACIGCGRCTWRIHVGTGALDDERVIADEPYLQAPPRLDGGRVVWLHANGSVGLYTVATGALESVVPTDGSPWSAPVLHDGALWWYGYFYAANQSGIVAHDLTLGTTSLKTPAQISESLVAPSGSFSGVARWQPFLFDSEGGLVWTEWGGSTTVVKRWRPGSAATVAALDPARSFLSVVPASRGRLVTKSYLVAAGCSEQLCEPSLELRDGDAVVPLASPGRPSVFGRPVVAGERVFWIDFRDGPYAIWSRRLDAPDAPAERITSEEAVVGAASPPSATATRVVWMDRRDGLWRVYGKRL